MISLPKPNFSGGKNELNSTIVTTAVSTGLHGAIIGSVEIGVRASGSSSVTFAGITPRGKCCAKATRKNHFIAWMRQAAAAKAARSHCPAAHQGYGLPVEAPTKRASDQVGSQV